MDDKKHQTISTEVDYLTQRLQPLCEGRAVALQVLTPGASGKRKDPLMTITPGPAFGFPKSMVVIAIINNGSCILDFNTKGNRRSDPRPLPKITPLILAGLSAKLSMTIVVKLQALLGYSKEKRNGNRTPPRSTRSTYPRPSAQRPRRPRCTPFREA